jgi:hypothetical protein
LLVFLGRIAYDQADGTQKGNPSREIRRHLQNRRAIERLVRTVFTRCDVKVVAASEATTLAFKIVNEAGAAVTRGIRIRPHHQPTPNRSWLPSKARYAGGA